MVKHIILIPLTIFVAIICFVSCKHKPNEGPGTTAVNTYGGFPDAVGKIIIDRCATAGCHNATSYTAAGGLLLDSWEHLFDGGNNGAVVVAYTPEMSSLMYFINTDSTNGDLIAYPTMPENGAKLTNDEYQTIKSWIASGAPDRNGNIPFASNPDTRQKIYMTQQACDWVAVIDAEKKVVMRYIKVGHDLSETEAPHNLHVDPDGKFAYVSFATGRYFQKINTNTDKIEAEADVTKSLTGTSWNVFFINPQNDKIILSNWTTNGGVATVDPVTMQRTGYFNFPLISPHGIASNASGDTFLVTAYGNALYKLFLGSQSNFKIDTVKLTGNPAQFVSGPNTLDPHEIVMTPDFSKYILTCEKSNEVRIYQSGSNQLLATIPVGTKPQEIALSPKNHLAFISCQSDVSAGVPAGFMGSIAVIDYQSNSMVKTIYGKFSQPHGITVDDKNGVLYVASQNTDGPAPHHPSKCGFKNGYYNIFSTTTFQPINNRTYEVSAQPYSSDIRFKH